MKPQKMKWAKLTIGKKYQNGGFYGKNREKQNDNTGVSYSKVINDNGCRLIELCTFNEISKWFLSTLEYAQIHKKRL